MRHLLKQKTEELRTCIYKGLSRKKPAFAGFFVLFTGGINKSGVTDLYTTNYGSIRGIML